MRKKSKMRQVTDNIHGTIYLSVLESELISTPYFYRLHDVYQSSTVYLTFPSNRTKRYEHSLGAMEIASEILFSSIANADRETKQNLFRKLEDYAKNIIEALVSSQKYIQTPYLRSSTEIINRVFNNFTTSKGLKYNEKIWSPIKQSIIDGDFSDPALDHFQYHSTLIDEEQDNSVKTFFLYRCLIEAIRICALFHDVGHPPYSHIIEKTIGDICDLCITESKDRRWEQGKVNQFVKTMSVYFSDSESGAFKPQTLFSNSNNKNSEFHEQVGLVLLQFAINDVIPQILKEELNDSANETKTISMLLYHIITVEFIFAILVEKDDFFKAFHKIIDGYLDSDRLDYIMRDSVNSGVDWGRIPYKRIINSAKLFINDDKKFIVAYPKKLIDDINDLMLIRYKIFARINLHHRCVKSSVALQSSVRCLSEDYFSKENDEDCINADINRLWNSLFLGVGNKQINIIQWNDSWLISVLHRALINIYENDIENKELKENLEEILLNKKRYYSLLKRNSDSVKLIQMIYNKAGITPKRLEDILKKEFKRYGDSDGASYSEENVLGSPRCDARESIRRIISLQKAYNSGDLEILNLMLPLEKTSLINLMEQILNDLKNNSIIADYSVIENKGRSKIGIPSNTGWPNNLYLYDSKQIVAFDDTVLHRQLQPIMSSVPWVYIYYVPSNTDRVEDKLFEKLSDAVAEQVKNRFDELFGQTGNT